MTTTTLQELTEERQLRHSTYYSRLIDESTHLYEEGVISQKSWLIIKKKAKKLALEKIKEEFKDF